MENRRVAVRLAGSLRVDLRRIVSVSYCARFEALHVSVVLA